MCGIFGAIGNYSRDKLKILAIMNEERGKDSFGMYYKEFSSNKGRIFKINARPTDVLDNPSINEYMDSRNGIYLGHTRYGTTGAKTAKNAHPFKYGNIVGTHNGIIYNHRDLGSYEVDSEVLFDFINKYGVSKGLSKISGYWGLAWTDKTVKDTLFLTAFNQTVYYMEVEGAIYYSSSKDHLSLIGMYGSENNINKVSEKQVTIIDNKLNISLGKKYTPKKRTYGYLTKGKSNSYYNSGSYGYPYYNYYGFGLKEDYKKEKNSLKDCYFCGETIDTEVEEVYYLKEGKEKYLVCGSCAPQLHEIGEILFNSDNKYVNEFNLEEG